MAKKKTNFGDKRNTNGFAKNPQNINRSGANRKTVSKVIKELEDKGVEQVKAKQIVDLFQSLLDCNEEELNEIANDSTQPMINRIVAGKLLDKEGFDIIEKMLDRVHGKATQKVESKEEVSTQIKMIEFIDTSKQSDE